MWPRGSPYAGDEVRLPESVETMIDKIRSERNQPALKKYARLMLAEIGEQASLNALQTILSSDTIASFGGYVSHWVKKNYPNVAAKVLAVYDSPHPGRTVSSTSSNSSNVESLQSGLSNLSVDSPSSSSRWTEAQSISSRQLSSEDEAQSSVASDFRETAENMATSEQLMILCKLEYRRLFMVLNYIAGRKLESAITVAGAQEIFSMKDLPMNIFETKIWNAYGQNFCAESDRIQYLAWDSGKTHHYYCYICRDGSYYFKGPYLNSTKTHLQRSLGDDNILIVKFLEDGLSVTLTANILKEGIIVGLRRYRFFVFKDERKKAKKNKMEKDKNVYSAVKCYFVHIDSVSPYGCDKSYNLFGKTISEARGMFMHIHTLTTVEKYMARLSLILSKTIKLGIDLATVTVEIIKDIPFQDENGLIIHDEDGKPILHTDGTGFISEDLAMTCPKDFSASKCVTDFEKCNQFVYSEHIASQQRGSQHRNKDPPLLMQCRLFYDGYAVKGTLLINRKLGQGTIQIRPSMIKVEKDQTLPVKETFNSLEIVNISRRPGRNSFSKYLIALLSYGGVPQEFFLNLLTNALEETRSVYSNRLSALKVASNYEGLDFGFVAQRMICSGVPLNEPYLQLCLSSLENGEKTKLKEGKIPVTDSFYLMGTADPTGVLNNDEVCVVLDNGPISGPVLVYRNPGLHFGDVHIMEAVYVKELEEFVGNAKFGIFFSTKGCRSAAYEMATGDFDGDMYWVSRNPELLKYFEAHEPWSRVYSVPQSEKRRNPQEFSNLELESQLFQLYLELRTSSFSMAAAADSWLSYMDRMLTLGSDRATEKNNMKKKMIKLVDIYYDALDAPKSGKRVPVPDELKVEMFPHHMEREPDLSYKSISVLGQIYDRVKEFKTEVPQKEIWKLSCFDVPIPEKYINMWKANYNNYRKDMCNALKCDDESKNDVANEVIEKYKQLLYEAPDMEESPKDSKVIYDEAIAIYHVTYDYAMRYGVEKCGFAWKVAGSALCSLCAWELAGPKEKPIVILPSVLRELFG